MDRALLELQLEPEDLFQTFPTYRRKYKRHHRHVRRRNWVDGKYHCKYGCEDLKIKKKPKKKSKNKIVYKMFSAKFLFI